MIRYITITLLALLTSVGGWAQGIAAMPGTAKAAVPPTQDSLRVSLLTIAAGGEIHALFGHTAIRCENVTRGIDVCYDYGMFDYDKPGFVMLFTLGLTDYEIGRSTGEYTIGKYTWLGRQVWQQELNLTYEQKVQLILALEENYRPENRMYRYDYFFDNCATRPRDMIERAVGKSLTYAEDLSAPMPDGMTLRDVFHQYTEGHPWSRFGIDLVMGSTADRTITKREMMFIPFYLQECFDKATIKSNETQASTPLVKRETTLINPAALPNEEASEGITPMMAAQILLILTAILSGIGVRKKRPLWGIDLVLFLTAGLAGCILFVLCFSQHYATSPNYLLPVFHPLHLLCLPWMLRRVARRRISRYMVANIVILTLFIVLWGVLPQEFPLAVLPLALCLWVRSLSNLLIYKKNRKTDYRRIIR